jgi:hypothetical protein
LRFRETALRDILDDEEKKRDAITRQRAELYVCLDQRSRASCA